MMSRGGGEGSWELPLLAEDRTEFLVIDTENDALLKKELVAWRTKIIDFKK